MLSILETGRNHPAAGLNMPTPGLRLQTHRCTALGRRARLQQEKPVPGGSNAANFPHTTVAQSRLFRAKLLGCCLSLLCAIVTGGLRPDHLQRKELTASRSGGWGLRRSKSCMHSWPPHCVLAVDGGRARAQSPGSQHFYQQHEYTGEDGLVAQTTPAKPRLVLFHSMGRTHLKT